MKNNLSKYPRQFWLLMAGSLIFTTGASLVWPFLSIYIQEKLGIPLRYSTLLISLRAVSGIIASFFFAGTFADRFGRRFLILASLCGGFIYYVGLTFILCPHLPGHRRYCARRSLRWSWKTAGMKMSSEKTTAKATLESSPPKRSITLASAYCGKSLQTT